MFQLKGEEFSKLIRREFTETATEVQHSGKQEGLFECYTTNHRSDCFDIMRFRSDFETDLQVNDFQDNSHVSLHFQLTGFSDARISGIDSRCPMKTGSFNLLNCVDPVSTFIFPQQKGYEYVCVGLKPVFFDDLLEQCGEDYQDMLGKSRQARGFSLFSESRSINPVQWDALRLLLDPPVADAIRPAYIRAKVEELTFLALGSLEKKTPGNSIRPEEKEKLFEVKRFLDQHFLDELNLLQISRLFLLNQFKLKTGFKSVFGNTVFGYIQQKRMAFARKMLEETAMSVGEIAAATGYDSDTSFIRSFRTHHGISPGKLKGNRFKS